MILKRLQIPGNFVQAHPYFDTLWLMRMDGTVQAFDIEAYASEQLNGSGEAAVIAFARNDQLRTPDGLAHLGAQSPDVQRFLQSSAAIEVSPTDVDAYSYSFAVDVRLSEAIDLRFYSGRAYAATDAGMVHFRAQGRDELSSAPIGTSRRTHLALDRCTEAMPLQIQARLGTVAASCGEEGGLYATGANTADNDWSPALRKFADISFACEFAGAGLVNLEGPVRLSALPADKIQSTAAGRRSRGEADEVVEITSIATHEDPLAAERFDRAAHWKVNGEVKPIQTFATTKRAFVRYSDGSMVQFPIADRDGFAHGTARPMLHAGPGSRILSMTTAVRKVIAECREDVQIFANWNWHRLYDGPVFSVRGYPQSRWYRNLITIVGTDRVELILVIEDD